MKTSNPKTSSNNHSNFLIHLIKQPCLDYFVTNSQGDNLLHLLLKQCISLEKQIEEKSRDKHRQALDSLLIIIRLLLKDPRYKGLENEKNHQGEAPADLVKQIADETSKKEIKKILEQKATHRLYTSETDEEPLPKPKFIKIPKLDQIVKCLPITAQSFSIFIQSQFKKLNSPESSPPSPQQIIDIILTRVKLELIEKRKIDINAADPSGKTILHYITTHGTPWQLERWLKHSPDVNIGTKDQKETPLFAAMHRVSLSHDDHSKNQSLTILNHLLNYPGLNPQKNTTRTGENILHFATECKQHNAELIAIITRKSSHLSQQKDQAGETPLHKAVKADNLEAVTALLEHGGSLAINIQNKAGNTPLHLAKSEHVVQALLEHHANILVRNRNKQTAEQSEGMSAAGKALILEKKGEVVTPSSTLELKESKNTAPKPTDLPSLGNLRSLLCAAISSTENYLDSRFWQSQWVKNKSNFANKIGIRLLELIPSHYVENSEEHVFLYKKMLKIFALFLTVMQFHETASKQNKQLTATTAHIIALPCFQNILEEYENCVSDDEKRQLVKLREQKNFIEYHKRILASDPTIQQAANLTMTYLKSGRSDFLYLDQFKFFDLSEKMPPTAIGGKIIEDVKPVSIPQPIMTDQLIDKDAKSKKAFIAAATQRKLTVTASPTAVPTPLKKKCEETVPPLPRPKLVIGCA